MMLKVFLDDTRIPSQIYGEEADKEWTLVETTEKVKELLKTGEVSHLSLDNDLGVGQEEGYKVVEWMIHNNIWPTEDIFIHTANIVRGRQMREDVKRYYYGCVKVQWAREGKG